MDASKSKVTLTFVISSGTATREEMITQDIVKIGKDPKSHLRLDDEAAFPTLTEQFLGFEAHL
jgi:hypothetical protein